MISGEKKWLQEVEDGYWDEVENPEVPVRRPEGESCGLKNLGATCYVNSLLQVSFDGVQSYPVIMTCHIITRYCITTTHCVKQCTHGTRDTMQKRYHS